VTIQGGRVKCARPFAYEGDASRGNTSVGEGRGGSDEDSEYSVLGIARMLIKMVFPGLGDVDKKITYVEDRPFNDKRYYISNDKVKKLGRRIEVDFMEGVRGGSRCVMI